MSGQLWLQHVIYYLRLAEQHELWVQRWLTNMIAESILTNNTMFYNNPFQASRDSNKFGQVAGVGTV